MLDIKVNNQSLNLGGNASIGIELVSPLFDRSRIPGIISYPFKIPNTNTNRKILGFPEILSSTEKAETFADVQLFIEHVLYKIGTLKSKDSGPDEFQINFKSDSGDVQEKIKNVKLADIDLGSDALNYGVVNNYYPIVKYAMFPVKNPDFYGDNNPDFAGYMNYYDGNLINNTGGDNKNCLVPFPYLLYILDKVGEYIGYTFSGDWLTEESVMRTVIYNNYAEDEVNGGNNDYTNLLWSFNNHVPDITIGQFFIALQNFFGLAFNFNPITKICKIIRLKDVADSRVYKNWTERTVPGYRKIPYEYNGFTLLQTESNSDKLFEEQDKEFLEYRIGNGGEPINTRASTMFMTSETDSEKPTRDWLIPEIKQPGSSPEFEQGTNDYGLRFMMYRGLQPDSLSNNYPLGTWDIKDYAGSAISGAEKTLHWDGENGLYTQNWKDWLDLFQNTSYVERQRRINIEELLNFDFTQKILIENVLYLPVSLRLNVNQKSGIQPASMKLFKVNL